MEEGSEADNSRDTVSIRRNHHLRIRKVTPNHTHYTAKELGLVLEDDRYRDMVSIRKRNLYHLSYRKATPIGTPRRQVLEVSNPLDKVCSRISPRMVAATNSRRKTGKVESGTVCVGDNVWVGVDLAWEEAHNSEGMDSNRRDYRRDGKEGVHDGSCCNHCRHRKNKKRHDASPSFEDDRPRHSQG